MNFSICKTFHTSYLLRPRSIKLKVSSRPLQPNYLLCFISRDNYKHVIAANSLIIGMKIIWSGTTWVLQPKWFFFRRQPVYFINLFATNTAKSCSDTTTPINMCCYSRLCIRTEMLNIVDKIFHNSDLSVWSNVV